MRFKIYSNWYNSPNFNGENKAILNFATAHEPNYEIPDGDLKELKKVFDILDAQGKQNPNIKEIMKDIEKLELI